MKRFYAFTVLRWLWVFILGFGALVPRSVGACACGCGVFDVGTSSMFQTHPGGMAWVEYDYMNQNRNWAGSSPSSANNNSDKQILTNFFTFGHEFMLTREWGFMVEVPYWARYFKTDVPGEGDVQGVEHNAMGDLRIKGIYTGLSENMSTGVTFGLKLPTGDFTYPNFDADTEIGTGSTDFLLGLYHLGEIPHSNWDWFANAQGDQPMLHYSGYLPGSEIDAVVGVYYDAWKMGHTKIAPLAQIIGSHRWSDSGTLADAPDSGYSRVLLTPGIEFDTWRLRIYADVGFPVYQYTTGNQLIASELYKLNIGFHF